MIDSELKSLVNLFDDTDEPVITAVNERMMQRGVSVIADLSKMLSDEKSDKAREYISERINYLSVEFTMDYLEKEANMEFPDLVNGIFLISKLVTPDLPRGYFDDLILPMADQMLQEISEDKTAVEKVEIFNEIFYRRLLFQCRNYPPTRESTALVINSLKARHGSPIPIAIIYFMLARYSGVDVYPLCFPGGLVPAYIEKDKALFYVDVFRKGDIFSEEKLREFLESQGQDVDSTIFEVREDRVLMVIYLESLLFLFNSNHDTERVELITRALDLFGDERFLERGEGEDE